MRTMFPISFRLNFLVYAIVFAACILPCSAQIILSQTKQTGIYQSGNRVQVKAFVQGGLPDSVFVTIHKNYGKDIKRQSLKFTGDTLLVFDEVTNGPSTCIFQVTTTSDTANIGFITDPEKFKPGLSRPKDFDQFWNKEITALKKLPLMVKALPVPAAEGSDYECLNVELNCLGTKPARGYFAKPSSATPKSLPIVLYLHAAGVSGYWCKSEPGIALRYAKMGKGALCFDLNAHGMLNGQPDDYYKELENGELKNYATQGVESREEFYFRGMYLRLVRALDFLTQQPEWDGQRILVIGESQGGGQALAAAGLDKRVSAVVATVPAMCDWGGTLIGRKGGWPNPLSTLHEHEKMLATLPYFDAANLVQNTKAIIVAEVGLVDYTCPSSAVYAALNQAKTKKIIYAVPYRPHHVPQGALKKLWEQTVEAPKNDFIQAYLK